MADTSPSPSAPVKLTVDTPDATGGTEGSSQQPTSPVVEKRKPPAYYPMPESWHRLNRSLSIAIYGQFDADNELEQRQEPPAPTWEECLKRMAADIAGQVASGFLPGVGSFIIGRLLSRWFEAPSIVGLHQDALNEIAEVVRQALEANLITEYMGMVNAARDKLLAYSETQDVSLLNDNLFHLFDVVGVLKQVGVNALGAFGMGANIHLLAILAKAEHTASYMTTFNRLKTEYAGHMVNLCNSLRDTIVRQANNAAPCTCGDHQTGRNPPVWVHRCRMLGNPVSQETLGLTGQDETRRRVRERCNQRRQEGIDAEIAQRVAKGVDPFIATAESLGSGPP